MKPKLKYLLIAWLCVGLFACNHDENVAPGAEEVAVDVVEGYQYFLDGAELTDRSEIEQSLKAAMHVIETPGKAMVEIFSEEEAFDDYFRDWRDADSKVDPGTEVSSPRGVAFLVVKGYHKHGGRTEFFHFGVGNNTNYNNHHPVKHQGNGANDLHIPLRAKSTKCWGINVSRSRMAFTFYEGTGHRGKSGTIVLAPTSHNDISLRNLGLNFAKVASHKIQRR